MVDGAERFEIDTVHKEKGAHSQPFAVVIPTVVGGMGFFLSEGAVKQRHRHSHLFPPSINTA
jgi:hypothetical protein